MILVTCIICIICQNYQHQNGELWYKIKSAYKLRYNKYLWGNIALSFLLQVSFLEKETILTQLGKIKGWHKKFLTNWIKSIFFWSSIMHAITGYKLQRQIQDFHKVIFKKCIYFWTSLQMLGKFLAISFSGMNSTSNS